MIKFVIDNHPVETEEGKTVLEAARNAGIHIPTLCYHKELSPYGACRVCLVEVTLDHRCSVQSSCTYPAIENLVVRTDTERVRNARNVMFELLLARSPEADQIKALAAEYGVTETRLQLDETSKCILCGLCVRVCSEITGRSAINFAFRGGDRKVLTPFRKISDTCIGCRACGYVCPTGAIEIEEA